MSKLKKVIHILNEIEDAFVFLICILLFLTGLYALIDSYLVYQHANDTSLLKHKPGYKTEEVDREIVGNMVAWISLEDTNIDYPVMQGINNEEYLNKDPYGDYSLSGSIFLDFRNQSGFYRFLFLNLWASYGGNHMFGSLHSYLKEDFFKKHKMEN